MGTRVWYWWIECDLVTRVWYWCPRYDTATYYFKVILVISFWYWLPEWYTDQRVILVTKVWYWWPECDTGHQAMILITGHQIITILITAYWKLSPDWIINVHQILNWPYIVIMVTRIKYWSPEVKLVTKGDPIPQRWCWSLEVILVTRSDTGHQSDTGHHKW